ncbi:uncharacterized protein PFL1_04379 [Pseudozyma flocculosa PF-1]|uniref:GST N-terminal domain-containing protein n=2 Tax=Pseudozyma flocculosa TaxID=84751 RepID=A0A5C3FCQ2_9BASI|nr:uncharacterized protein PFL1_04379 [Pseudozyma flocculosa PF-1]EPQ28052.1 hypothetical protein PFL1_04379 [Pseudozyma flocculosa PF-1]SPO42213.1 uncharacterized protein PSFLO_07696 [Pseudozyma flocculosa]
MTSAQPKAVLYTFDGSVWGSAPRLALVEKGYADQDLEIKIVDLAKGENFSPSYLRINAKGTVPSLVVPILETTSAEVDTKFRALTDSKPILEFLDKSRSQPILDSKGEGLAGAPAPVLAPATIEGKALSDEIIKLVHADTANPNKLFLGARSVEELQKQKQGFVFDFVKNSTGALQNYQREIESASTATADGSSNPRSSATVESLKKWYSDKLASQSVLRAAYLDNDASAAETLVQETRALWHGIATAVDALESRIKGPLALGDQISLADLHIVPWLARVLTVCRGYAEGASVADDIDALDAALKSQGLSGHKTAAAGVGPKLREFWATMKQRPSFQAVYGAGLH